MKAFVCQDCMTRCDPAEHHCYGMCQEFKRIRALDAELVALKARVAKWEARR